jgi:hypothetical protein
MNPAHHTTRQHSAQFPQVLTPLISKQGSSGGPESSWEHIPHLSPTQHQTVGMCRCASQYKVHPRRRHISSQHSAASSACMSQEAADAPPQPMHTTKGAYKHTLSLRAPHGALPLRIAWLTSRATQQHPFAQTVSTTDCQHSKPDIYHPPHQHTPNLASLPAHHSSGAVPSHLLSNEQE